MSAEKGVRDGHTDALTGTAVLGGEGHFSLLDTVGDRGEGSSSIGGLLDRGTREETGQEGEKQRIVRHVHIKEAGCYPICWDLLERDGFSAQQGVKGARQRRAGGWVPSSLLCPREALVR